MASDPEDIPMQPPLEPLPASFDHGSSTSIPSPNMMSFTSAAIVSQRRRRKHPASLKRSASTPNVRELDDPGMTLAEKRRNKLGYHRTSVACGMFSFALPYLTLIRAAIEPFFQDIVGDARYAVCSLLKMRRIDVPTAFD